MPRCFISARSGEGLEALRELLTQEVLRALDDAAAPADDPRFPAAADGPGAGAAGDPDGEWHSGIDPSDPDSGAAHQDPESHDNPALSQG